MPVIDLLLWSKVKSGDAEAFEMLFKKYYPQLCILSRRYTNNINDAREVVQNLFIYLWENRDELNVNFSFRSYLYRAVKYNSIRFIENDKKTGIRMDDMPENDHNREFFDHIEYAELQGKILETINTLPDQCKKIFMLSRFEQLKYAEIAAKLNLSVKTVESHITKALRILHENLNDYQ